MSASRRSGKPYHMTQPYAETEVMRAQFCWEDSFLATVERYVSLSDPVFLPARVPARAPQELEP